MRVLVEQTRDSVTAWLTTLNLQSEIGLVVLMGGEDENDWDLCPERDAVVVGTQDMLLSRALNRGYAASRSRWPIQFALLNNDCRWVLDEVQLMGPGLATTAQLDSFRTRFATHGALSALWMSATLHPSWLRTVDFDPSAAELFELTAKDKSGGLKNVIDAPKPLIRAKNTCGDTTALALEVLNAHKPGSRTLVVVNTVRKALALYEHLEKAKREEHPNLPIALLHSRFRPGERKEKVDFLLKTEPGEAGTIVVSTQVVEAGVDVSAQTLFSELAPWSSLVQRFGRCNRRGEYSRTEASVFWVDVAQDDEAAAAPYDKDELDAARRVLKKCRDVGISQLPEDVKMTFPRTEVIRERTLVELFDTTPDLAGNDIDIDRYVRGADESDVRVFWRDYGTSPEEGDNKQAESAPSRLELCPAPIGSNSNPGFRDFVAVHSGQVWRWNFLEKKWEQARPSRIVPGQTFLIDARAGGYSPERGWDRRSDKFVKSPPASKNQEPPDGTDGDKTSRIQVWQTIAQHSDDVVAEVKRLVPALPLSKDEAEPILHAARWHDRGKAHQIFQNAIDDGQTLDRNGETITRLKRPPQWTNCRFVAKAPDDVWKEKQLIERGFWRTYGWLPKEGRHHFRHELASALSVIDPRNDEVPNALRDLVAYLVAAHHGKVRGSIRSLPNETHPRAKVSSNGNVRRFARGVWDGDELPETDLGGGVTAPGVVLSLEPMELGLCSDAPFEGQLSWADRMLRLRDDLGPFRLTYLEAVLRAADMRASRAAEEPEAKVLTPEGDRSEQRHHD